MTAREHLVIVLPGIGGSVLARPDDHSDVVWSAGFVDVGNILLRPERLSIGEHEHLEPMGLIRTRKAFGVWTAIPGYDGLLERLGKLPGAVVDDGSPCGHDLEATVLAVPYDFRRSIAEAAERLDGQVRCRLARLWPGEGARPRLLIVAHSLGGLVARYWLAQQDNWKLCRALITLGTPHRGAPKALDVLANGIKVLDPLRITRPVQVLREWASVAELLPRDRAVLDESGSGAGVLRRPHELSVGWLRGPALAAWEVHQNIEAGWAAMPSTRPEVIPRIGYGHGTLRRCNFDGRRVRVTRDVPATDPGSEGFGLWAADLGDGTVPAYCGLPLEMDHHSPQDLRVVDRHGPITNLVQIPGLLESYEGRPPRSPIRGEERPVVLGLDMNEVALAEATVGVMARIVGTDGEVSRVAVWATLSGLDLGGGRVETRLEWDVGHGVFRGELPTSRPGLAQVMVTAEAVPGGSDLMSSESVEVVDGDQLD